MILTLLAALYGAAQEAFIVYEGAESSHFVANHKGSTYAWKIFVDFSPDTEANPDEYEFLTPPINAEISIRWKQTGVYYLTLIETDVGGCSNTKAIVVNVVANDRSISFEATASGACINTAGNGLSLPLKILDSGGVPLGLEFFPLDIGFTVNDKDFSQQVTFEKQELVIENISGINTEQNDLVTIQLAYASDKDAKPLIPLTGKDKHVHTVYAIPVVNLLKSDEVVDEASSGNYIAGISTGETQNAVYVWSVYPPNATSTDLASFKNNNIDILWDGPTGFFNLSVSVVDGNGCYSEPVQKLIEVKKSDSAPIDVFAGPDTTISSGIPYPFADVYPDDDSYTYSWSPASNLDNPNFPHPVFTPGETTTYVLTVTSLTGVSVKDTVTINVPNILANAGTDLYMELGSTVMLNGAESFGAGITFSWTTINGSIDSGADTPNPVVSDFGTYYLEVTDKYNCTSIDSVSVIRLAHAPIANNDYDTTRYMTEVKIPVLDNDTDEENSIDSTSMTITLPPFNGTAYVDFDDYTIHYRPNQGFSGNDNFEYQICNTFNNCDRANVYVMVTDFNFIIPEAFSPNGDGINDYFEIVGIEYYENNSITIINRWGNKVYEAKNYGISSNPKFWDGKSNIGFRIGSEELPTGTYFYILNLGNNEQPISGSIYLDR